MEEAAEVEAAEVPKFEATNQEAVVATELLATKSTAPKDMGLCKDLGSHVFSYGHKGSADQFRTTLEQVVHYVGTKHGQSISTKLDTRTKVIVPEPVHDQALIDAHELDTAKLKQQKLKLINSMVKQRGQRQW